MILLSLSKVVCWFLEIIGGEVLVCWGKREIVVIDFDYSRRVGESSCIVNRSFILALDEVGDGGKNKLLSPMI